MKLRTLLAGLAWALIALAAESGAELFQKAVTQERAAGNLEEAIKLYQRVAKEFSSDRALAAKALVQAARCYEKLGEDKAVKLYEQVARDFTDQRELAEAARVRLAALQQPPPATMTLRKIQQLGRGQSFNLGVIDTDGQRTVYRDDTAGGLVFGDLAGRSKRLIFKLKPDEPLVWIPSRDFSMVLLALLPNANRPETFAVIKNDGTGYREIFKNDVFPTTVDWSWDNRYVVIRNAQRLVLVSVAEGHSRELLRVPTAAVSSGRNIRFSRDGRFIAYASANQVFLLPVNGGPPRLVSKDADVIDWTSDGRYLEIASTRSGSMALYLLPVKDGSAAGQPVFVRYGSFRTGRTTMAGGLVYLSASPGGNGRAFLTAIDTNGRIGAWKELGLAGGMSHGRVISWSPDGRQIAYVASNDDAGLPVPAIRIRNLATDEEREVFRLGDGREMWCYWAAEDPSLRCWQPTQQQTTEVFSLDVDSGRRTSLLSMPGYPWLVPSRDDAMLYFSDARALRRREIATGQEITLVETSDAGDNAALISPDGRWLFRPRDKFIEVRPVSGGQWKRLVSRRDFGHTNFSPDGNWIYYQDHDAAGREGLYRIATTGGEPERTGDFPSKSGHGGLVISPDGRQIIAECIEIGSPELSLLENFVPAARQGSMR
jgi:Tol biopolymer transport system component